MYPATPHSFFRTLIFGSYGLPFDFSQLIPLLNLFISNMVQSSITGTSKRRIIVTAHDTTIGESAGSHQADPADMVVTPIPHAHSPLFHPCFNEKHPEDVILRADTDDPQDDNLCFYASMPLLCSLSGFFDGLPSPSSGDTTDDTPIITLPYASTSGLAVFLRAIHAPTTSQARLPRSAITCESICTAAIIARVYDVPQVCEVLGSYVESRKRLYSPFLAYAIWALGNDIIPLAHAARATAGHDISTAPPVILDLLRQYAPDRLALLHTIHARGRSALTTFHTMLAKTTTDSFYAGSNTPDERCFEARKGDPIIGVLERLREAKTVEEIQAVAENQYGLQCRSCLAGATRQFNLSLRWLWSATAEGWLRDC